MKKMLLASLAAAAALVAAAPASAADFTGARVGATVGFADDDFFGTEAFTYGVNAGYDFDMGNLVVGATLELQDSNEDGIGRDISVTGRIGGKGSENALIYALAGYTNLGVEGTGVELDGVRVGAGVEFALSDRAFANVEYRYSNYEFDVDTHQTLVGLGFRF